METYLLLTLIISGLALIISTLCLIFILKRSKNGGTNNDLENKLKSSFESSLDRANNNQLHALTAQLKSSNDTINMALNNFGNNMLKSIDRLIEYEMENTEKSEKRMTDNNFSLKTELQERFDKLTSSTKESLTELREEVRKTLYDLRTDNNLQLDKMREVVDEKLSTTLDKRLKESFETVSKALESVSKNVGEMQSLAQGVTDLKKVLTNVKTRGVWGEVSLDNILKEVLTPEQYLTQAKLDKKSGEMVDFAIVLPGKDKDQIYLPIDCKFPMEDYMRLVEASESGDKANTDACTKALINAVKLQANSISKKYIIPSKTTEFAIMYLPTEGLYAEVVRQAGLMEEMQSKYRVVVAGPSTITALLNSLQLGFKTLAIEKRSREIWNLLATFKKSFETYNELLEKARNNVEKAANTIDEATKRSNMIQNKLSKVYVDELAESDSPTLAIGHNTELTVGGDE